MVASTHQSRSKVFSGEALAFDDVLLVPAFSDILPADVYLASKLTKSIENPQTICCDGYSHRIKDGNNSS